jgi:hypothetical protein
MFWFRFQNDIGTFLLSFLTSLAPGEASSDGEARAAPLYSPQTSAPSDDLKKRVEKKSEKRRRPLSSFSPSGWIPISDQAVFAAVQRARLLERWPPFTQPSPPGLFTAAAKQRDHNKPNILLIGASHHVSREGDVLAERGYSVTICSTPGWVASPGSVEEMAAKVKECLPVLRPKDIVIVQCLDNSVYMSRSEEGGDLLPIRNDGSHHVEGDLSILIAKDRQYTVFNTILPILQLLTGWKVIFVTPLPRYLAFSRCDELTHEIGFEKKLRDTLAECRRNFKDFLFTSNLRGFAVIDPSPAVPGNNTADAAAEPPVWGTDPVHPLAAGYGRLVDLFEVTMGKLLKQGGNHRRPAEDRGNNNNYGVPFRGNRGFRRFGRGRGGR